MDHFSPFLMVRGISLVLNIDTGPGDANGLQNQE